MAALPGPGLWGVFEGQPGAGWGRVSTTEGGQRPGNRPRSATRRSGPSCSKVCDSHNLRAGCFLSERRSLSFRVAPSPLVLGVCFCPEFIFCPSVLPCVHCFPRRLWSSPSVRSTEGTQTDKPRTGDPGLGHSRGQAPLPEGLSTTGSGAGRAGLQGEGESPA